MQRAATQIRVSFEGAEQIFTPAEAPIRVGRASTDEFVVANPKVSRGHVRIEFTDASWWVVDNGSSNGVFDRSTGRIDRIPLDGSVTIALGSELDAPTITINEELDDSTVLPTHARTSTGLDYTTSQDPNAEADESGDEADDGRTVIVGPSSGARQRTSGRGVAAATTIGRASTNSIVVDELGVSREHLSLRHIDAGTVEIEDHSSNGTYVDSEWVHRRTVRRPIGAVVMVSVGSSVFEVRNGAIRPRGQRVGVEVEMDGVGIVTAQGRTLLSDVSLQVGRSTMTAIVGHSGSGKSTLLRVLAGLQGASVGSVQLDGVKLVPGSTQFRERIGFVPQNDDRSMLLGLSPRQWLTSCASLRFEPEITASEIASTVERIAGSLGLGECIDVSLDRLSGGQRKRVNVATELLTEPPLLLLDEPTAGLDPVSEMQVLDVLRHLAERGITVITVTHSPTVAAQCDQVVVLSHGRLVSTIGGGELTEDGTASWLGLFDDARSEARPAETAGRTASRRFALAETETMPPRPARHPAAQFSVLVRRYATVLRADRRALAATFLQAPLIALFLLVVAHGAFEIIDGAPNQNSLKTLVALVLTLTYLGVSNAIREFVKERAVFERERFHGLSIAAYVGSKFVVLAAITIAQAVVLVAIVLATAGVPHGRPLPVAVWPPIDLFVGLALTGFCCVALGLAVSAMTRSEDKAVALLPVLLLGMYLFSGGVSDPWNTRGLGPIAQLNPATHGLSASASAVNVFALQRCDETTPSWLGEGSQVAPREADDRCRPNWASTRSNLITSIGALGALTTGLLTASWFVLRRTRRKEAR